MKELSLLESEIKAKEFLEDFDWKDNNELVISMVGFVMKCQEAGVRKGVGEKLLDEAFERSTLTKEQWSEKILESCILFLRFVRDVHRGWRPDPGTN